MAENQTTSANNPIPPLIKAALEGDLQGLQNLFENCRTPVEVIDNDASRKTALHHIVRQIGKTEEESKARFFACLKLLLRQRSTADDSSGNFVNIQDKTGNTALHYAIHSAVKPAIRMLLENNAGLGMTALLREKLEVKCNVNLGIQNREGKTALHWMIRFLGTDASEEKKDSYLDCFELLLENQEFENCVNIQDHDGNTALYYAARSGMENVVKILLDKRAKQDVVNMSGLTTLHEVVKQLRISSGKMKDHYIDCLKLLLSSKYIPICKCEDYVNLKDASGNTALHYAVLSGVQNAMVTLLKHGAKFDIQNGIGKTPIERIMPPILEQALDSCITTEHDFYSIDFAVTFDYSFLVQFEQVSVDDCEDVEIGIRGNQETANVGNPEFIEMDSLTRSHHESQQTSDAVFIKKKKANIKIYHEECKLLWYLANSTKHRYLLKHPIVTSFLTMKWHSISNFYYGNFVIDILAVIFLTACILLHRSSQENKDILVGLAITSSFLVWSRDLFFLPFAIINFTRTRSSCRQLKILLKGIFKLANSLGYIAVLYFSLSGQMLPRHLSALIVMLAWVEFLGLLALFPGIAFYVVLFRTVVFKSLCFLLGYSALFFGFTLSFFLVFETENYGGNNGNEKSSDSNFVFPFIFVKVVAMMTGELEFQELPFKASPITSRIILLMFIFLFTIVLLNLLNAMAVSDTQELRSEVETTVNVAKLKLISNCEALCIKLSRMSCLNFFLESLCQGVFLLDGTGSRFNNFVWCPQKNRSGVNSPVSDRLLKCRKFTLDDIILQRAYERMLKSV